MGKLAVVALLAEAPLVMFAYQVTDAASIFSRYIVPIRTSYTTRTLAFDEVLAKWSSDFGSCSKGREGLSEEGIEVESKLRARLRVEEMLRGG